MTMECNQTSKNSCDLFKQVHDLVLCVIMSFFYHMNEINPIITNYSTDLEK